MEASSTFCLNGLIGLVVEGPQRYRRFFANEYQRMERPLARDNCPCVTLRITDRVHPEARREKVYNNLFRFTYSVADIDTPRPVLTFERHWLDRVAMTALGSFIQGQLLEPLVYLKLAESGILLMHAAGAAKDGKAYVFPAHGGTGKTTLALSLAQGGFGLMGDDLLMVEGSSGIVHPFPRPLHLFTYNLKTMAVPFDLEAMIRAKDALRFVLNTISGQRFLISTRVHVDDLFSVRFAESAPLERLVFLRRAGGREVLSMHDPEARQRAVRAILESADLNTSLYANYCDVPAWRMLEAELVNRVLGHVDELIFVNARAMATPGDRAAFAGGLLTNAA